MHRHRGRRRRCLRWRGRAWARCWRCSARTGASLSPLTLSLESPRAVCAGGAVRAGAGVHGPAAGAAARVPARAVGDLPHPAPGRRHRGGARVLPGGAAQALNSTLSPSPLKHVQNDYASAAEQRVHHCQCIHGIKIRGSWEFSWMPSRRGGPAHPRHGCCVITSACLHEQKSSPWRSAQTGVGRLRV